MIPYQLAKKLKDAGFPQSELALAQQKAGYDYVSMPPSQTSLQHAEKTFVL